MTASLDTLMQAAHDAAKLAGAFAMRHYRTDITIDTKRDGSPVTIADRGAEEVVRQWIHERFPDDAIQGEEFAEQAGTSARRWVIDPIDGTKSFVRGVPLWGSLVAVVEGERVLAGAACFAAIDETITAAAGCGTWCNGVRARVSDVASLAAATVLITDERTAAGPTTDGRPGNRWESLARRAALSRTWGDLFGYLLVATGRAEVMVDPVVNPWDVACFLPIIEEAGGVFTDLDGNVSAFGGHVVATNSALGGKVRALLAGTEQQWMDLDTLDFEKGNGLVTVVAQHAITGQVLMVAFANREALERTITTGEMHYQSRTRGLWHKGGTSGNVQRVASLAADCDRDAVLARVLPAGPACHTGATTCFGDVAADVLAELDALIDARAASGAGAGPSYTAKLLADRNLRLKKIGEEASEFVMACADADAGRASAEAADLIYHLLVALHAAGGSLDDVRRVLSERRQ